MTPAQCEDKPASTDMMLALARVGTIPDLVFNGEIKLKMPFERGHGYRLCLDDAERGHGDALE